MHHPLTDIQADFEMNRPTRYHIITKRNYGWTDRRRVLQQYVVFFEKKILKIEHGGITCSMLRRDHV